MSEPENPHQSRAHGLVYLAGACLCVGGAVDRLHHLRLAGSYGGAVVSRESIVSGDGVWLVNIRVGRG